MWQNNSRQNTSRINCINSSIEKMRPHESNLSKTKIRGYQAAWESHSHRASYRFWILRRQRYYCNCWPSNCKINTSWRKNGGIQCADWRGNGELWCWYALRSQANMTIILTIFVFMSFFIHHIHVETVSRAYAEVTQGGIE